MSTQIQAEHFTQALYALLDETFDNVQGFYSCPEKSFPETFRVFETLKVWRGKDLPGGLYLDKGTSLFETLATLTAAEASIPVGGQCATLAAQVKHVAFYLEVMDNSVRDPNYPKADWGEIWRTVSTVTPTEWEAIRAELRARYNRILNLIKDTPAWSSEVEIGDAIAAIAHTAYHLGEIRQALCIIKPVSQPSEVA